VHNSRWKGTRPPTCTESQWVFTASVEGISYGEANPINMNGYVYGYKCCWDIDQWKFVPSHNPEQSFGVLVTGSGGPTVEYLFKGNGVSIPSANIIIGEAEVVNFAPPEFHDVTHWIVSTQAVAISLPSQPITGSISYAPQVAYLWRIDYRPVMTAGSVSSLITTILAHSRC